MPFSILCDAPASIDQLDFDRYCAPLVELLSSENIQTPFTIGIFGSWGSGKTTLLRMLGRKLKTQDRKFLCVDFNPWIYRKEPSLLIPLLHAIRDAMTESFEGKFQDSANKLTDVLLHIGADLLLRHLTATAIDLDKLEKYEHAYLQRKGVIDSQLRNLRRTLQEQTQKLYDSGTTLVLLIDDLDRCDPTEMIDMLENLKLFLDVEHIVHVLAVDKEVIDRGIEVKYGKFSFDSDRKASLGAEYLEKMIQLPVYLYPLHDSQIKGYVTALDLSKETAEQLDFLSKALSPNPRKIKRVLNAVAFTRHSLNGKEVDWSIVTALAILRIEHPEIYADVAQLPDLLIALHNVYAGKWSIAEDSVDFVKDFGPRQSWVRERCALHYKPATTLAQLFAVEFTKHKGRLAEYVSVVGGTR